MRFQSKLYPFPKEIEGAKEKQEPKHVQCTYECQAGILAECVIFLYLISHYSVHYIFFASGNRRTTRYIIICNIKHFFVLCHDEKYAKALLKTFPPSQSSYVTAAKSFMMTVLRFISKIQTTRNTRKTKYKKK